MREIGEQIFFFLVFPGIAFSVLLGLCLTWIDRKVTAMVQWRVGPPPSQPAWDVIKLLGKEVVLPAEGWKSGFLAIPFAALSAAGIAAALVWMAALGFRALPVGDLIVVLYLLAFPAVAIILGGSCSGNPLGAVGASREMKLIVAYELPLVLAVMVPVFQQRHVAGESLSAMTFSLSGIIQFQSAAGSIMMRPSGVLAFIVALLCCQAKLGFVPFDLSEAECEIGEGALIEYAGAPLAILKLTQAILLALVPTFLVVLFWGGIQASAIGVLAFSLKFLLIVVLFVLIKNTSPRVRIDQALHFFWGPATIVAIIALTLAVMGA